MIVLTAIIGILFIFSVWRRLHVQKEEEVFKSRMFALRDKLREHATAERIDKKNWIFQHFDRTFSKQINESYYITLYALAIMAYRYRDNKEVEHFQEKLKAETDNNPYLKQVHEEQLAIVKHYVVNQHLVTYWFARLFMGLPIEFISASISFVRNGLKNVSIFPETSNNDDAPFAAA